MAVIDVGNSVTIVNGLSSPWDVYQPGDVFRVLNRPSQDLLRFRNLTGTAEQPIIVRNEEGYQIVIDDNSNSFCIIFENTCSYIELRGDGDPDIQYGFDLRGQATGWAIRQTEGSEQFVYNRLEISTGNIGFSIFSTDGQGYPNTERLSGLEIYGCYIHDITDEGIYFGSSDEADSFYDNAYVHDNYFYRCGRDSIQMKHGDNIHVYDNLLVESCTENEAAQRSALRMGNWLTNSYCYRNKLLNDTFNGIAVNTLTGYGPVDVYNNLVILSGQSGPNDGAIILQQNDTVRVYQNTIIDTNGDGIGDNNADAAHAIKYNIVINSSSNDLNASGSDVEGNITSDVFRDVDNYDLRLVRTSASRDAGSLSLYPSDDYILVPRPKGPLPCVGAYEYFAPEVVMSAVRRRRA